jgi:nucleoside-diphosphate-sugar epimerase
VSDKETTAIALLGGNTVVGHALTLLLRGTGYEVSILDAPPTGLAEDLLAEVDLLLICPGLDDGRRKESLAALRGARRRIRVPVLELSTAVEDGLLDNEVRMVPWPINLGGLAREIENALKTVVHDARVAVWGEEEPPTDGEVATL